MKFPKFKLFGKIKDDEAQVCHVLREAEVMASPKALRAIAKHFMEVADEMEDPRYSNQDHWHFNPRVARRDIVISRVVKLK